MPKKPLLPLVLAFACLLAAYALAARPAHGAAVAPEAACPAAPAR